MCQCSLYLKFCQNISDSNTTAPTTTATAYAQALSGGEVSVTAVVGPKTVPALPKQQPPIVSMFPVSKILQGGPPILQPEVQVKGMILFLVYAQVQADS